MVTIVDMGTGSTTDVAGGIVSTTDTGQRRMGDTPTSASSGPPLRATKEDTLPTTLHRRTRRSPQVPAKGGTALAGAGPILASPFRRMMGETIPRGVDLPTLRRMAMGRTRLGRPHRFLLVV